MTQRLKALACAALFAAMASTPSAAASHKVISFKDDPHARTMPVYQPLKGSISPGPGRYERKAVKGKRAVVKRAVVKPAPVARTLTGYGETIARGSVSLSGVVPELAHFARSVMADCGSKVISALRNTRVRGSGAVSLHASGRAIDIAGNPSCIARHLAHWRGGASNDYHRISPPHYHVSWGGREQGRRFAHYTGRKAKRVRTARVW